MRRDSSISFRTLAYTLSVIFLGVWMISLSSIVLGLIVAPGEQGELNESIADANQVLAMLIIFIMLPISVMLPPLFIRRKIRLTMALLANIVTSFLLMMYLLTALIWACVSPPHIVLTKLLTLAVELVTTIMLLSCMFIMSTTRIRSYQDKVPSPIYSAVGLHQGLHHTSHVFLVVGAALLSALGECLSNNKTTSSQAYTGLLPLFLFTLLFVVQVRHYTITHMGWFTRSRAMERVKLYIRQYPLSELEKELVNEKKLAKKLIDGAFTATIYSRPAWSL